MASSIPQKKMEKRSLTPPFDHKIDNTMPILTFFNLKIRQYA